MPRLSAAAIERADSDAQRRLLRLPFGLDRNEPHGKAAWLFEQGFRKSTIGRVLSMSKSSVDRTIDSLRNGRPLGVVGRHMYLTVMQEIDLVAWCHAENVAGRGPHVDDVNSQVRFSLRVIEYEEHHILTDLLGPRHIKWL